MAFDIYLISPPIHDAEAFRPLLASAMAALSPASLLIDVPQGDERAQINLIKTLAPLAQEAGVAVLVNTAPHIAVRGGADGVHVTSPLLISEAREILKTERIVGVGGLTSRDDAMDAGEAGADYVMFGEPRADGTLMTLSQLVDRSSWWAEVFQIPCVAYAASAEAVEAIALTRAEFVALGPWCFGDLPRAAEAVASALQSLAKSKQPA